MRLATTMLLLTLPTTIAAQAPADELASYHRAREVTRAGMDALGGDCPFIMISDGKLSVFTPSGLKDAPLPAH